MVAEWYALVCTSIRVLVRAEKMSRRRIDEYGGIILEEKFIQGLSFLYLAKRSELHFNRFAQSMAMRG